MALYKNPEGFNIKTEIEKFENWWAHVQLPPHLKTEEHKDQLESCWLDCSRSKQKDLNELKSDLHK